jgi:hypothetical protein
LSVEQHCTEDIAGEWKERSDRVVERNNWVDTGRVVLGRHWDMLRGGNSILEQRGSTDMDLGEDIGGILG